MDLSLDYLDPSRVRLEPLQKGMTYLNASSDGGEPCKGLNVLREELSLPAATLVRHSLLHNLEWMRRFIAAYGLNLAPHGKTTMAPKLYKMQLDARAWGITLATAQQTALAYRHGVRRVLMANQLVGRRNFELISEMVADPGFEFYCLVDSPELIEAMGQFFGERRQRIGVLLEVGTHGGRAGVRDVERLQQCVSALAQRRDSVRLCGVELYEGVFREEAPVREFIARAVAVAGELLNRGVFERSPFILSGAGSAWFDVVAEMFTAAGFGAACEIVLRPGCYLTHDAGLYEASQDRMTIASPIAREIGSRLLPALKLWAYVQSIPEPGLGIVALGKRDASFDSGLPKPWMSYRPGDEKPTPAPQDWEITKIMDQHSFLRFAEPADLRVGDIVAFDIAHPCLTFDKWRFIPIVDDSFTVVDIVQTFF